MTSDSHTHRSCVEWPPGVFTSSDGTHISTDDHYSYEEAEHVCNVLQKHGFGGNGPKPLRVWV